ncbi:MAG: hypothetical protein IIB66_10885, partial [Proteobacteria bacterium]|nr:hypothetical protein [Pseudomonadota bacterium]
MPAEPTGARLKVVFMLPHWSYNVDREATLAAIEAMAREPSIQLVVKEHPRGTGGLPAEMKARLDRTAGAETVDGAASVALVAWSEAVICFGSSIGLEAHLQAKP